MRYEAPRRNPRRLTIERLEERNPASTVLDALLAGLSAATPSDDPLFAIPGRARMPSAGTATQWTGWSADAGVSGFGSAGGGSRTRAGVRSIDFDTTRTREVRDAGAMPAPAFVAYRPLAASAVSAVAAPAGGAWTLFPPTVGVAAANPAAVTTDTPGTEPTGPIVTQDDPQPVVTLTASTNYIPVNANNTSGSPWQKDTAGRTLTGLPAVRDFDLSPMHDLSEWDGQGQIPDTPPIEDPELKKMTVTIQNAVGGEHYVSIYVTFASGTSAEISLWRDALKQTGIPLEYLLTVAESAKLLRP